MKYENNQYTTLINVEINFLESDSTLNIVSKHCKLLTTITLLNPSAKIIIDDDTTIHNHKEFLIKVDYATSFIIINYRKAPFQKNFVLHVINSTRPLSSMKHGDDDIMVIFHKNKTWLSQDDFSTHRESSIGFIKYIITAFTLQQVTKERIVNTLMNLDLSKEEIFIQRRHDHNQYILKEIITDGQPKVPE